MLFIGISTIQHPHFSSIMIGKLELEHDFGEKRQDIGRPRIVAALLENNQTPDGIRIPEALIPYTGFDMIK